MILDFIVREQTVCALPNNSIPRRGSSEYLKLRFHFCEDWSGYTKTIFLQHEQYSKPYFVDKSGIVQIPKYFSNQTNFSFMLVGTYGDVSVPTNPLMVCLEESGEYWEEDPPSDEGTAYGVLLRNVAELMNDKFRTKDVSADFAEALQQDGSLSAEEYLWSMPQGTYVITGVGDGWSYRLSRLDSGFYAYRELLQVLDDEVIFEIYASGLDVDYGNRGEPWCVMSTSGGLAIGGKVLATKDYVDNALKGG